jgi:TetR/AcrR family transcriptional repressor of uid operon
MPKPATPRHGTDRRRDDIRRAAYRCFRLTGYHETTVDDICLAAQASKGSFYWHYGSKQDVFIDLLETWTREVMDQVHTQFLSAVRQHDYIRATTEALEREIRRGRVIVPLWLDLTVQARREKDIRDALSRFYRRARAAIAEMLRPSLEDLASEEDLQGLAGTIFGAYAGVMMQEQIDPEAADARHAVQHFMSVLGKLVLRPGAERLVPSEEPPMATTGPRRRSVAARTKAASQARGGGARVETSELSAFLDGAPADSQHRVAELRALLFELAPDADERVIHGWKVLAYGRSALVAYLKVRRDGVHLGFYDGADLSDPLGLLTGEGKRMRHVRLPLREAVELAPLRELVRAAFDAHDALRH